MSKLNSKLNILFPYYCISGILLALATPASGLWPLIFIAFTPLITGLETDFKNKHLDWKQAFLKGLITGLFYSVSLFYWITNINKWVVIPVTLIFSCMHAFLALGIYLGLRIKLKKLTLYLWIACLWVSIEFIASDPFFSIPSCAIGYNLWQQPLLLQTADFAGVFGISFWVISINVSLASWLIDGYRNSLLWISATLFMTLFILGYGYLNYSNNTRKNPPLPPLNVNAVYTAITTEYKSDPNHKKEIFHKLMTMTSETPTEPGKSPNLFIWPETSVPAPLRSIREKDFIIDLLNLAHNKHSSIVLGAHSFAWNQEDKLKKFNAAFLVPDRGYISQEYRKVILAPGVETPPLPKILPKKWVEEFNKKSFTPGKELGLMKLNQDIQFGIFICWEAFFPDFVRHLADNGAGFLVNITNDEPAFKDMSSAYSIPYTQTVLRAIENRRYLIRCANWGQSMFISPQGKILNTSAPRSEGVISNIITPNYNKTFFTKHGFILAKIMLFLTLIGLGLIILRNVALRKVNKSHGNTN